MVKGHLDGLTGSYIVGWAEDGPATCTIVVKQSNGKVIAKGLASQERPDLASLFLGRTNLAFRIPLPLMPKRSKLHVFANGLELPNSPLEVGTGLFDGFIAVVGGCVEGWVTERSAEFTAPIITIQDQDGRIVGESQSTKPQESSDAYFLPARFFAELDQRCFGCGEIHLTAFANGVQFATALCNLQLKGNLEQLTQDTCSGWLFSPDAPGRRFDIEVFRNGISEGIAKCRTHRTDVTTLFPTSKSQGFAKSIPSLSFAILDLTTISLRLPNSDAELFDGPFVLGERAAVVGAARRAARVALDGTSGLTAGERAVLHSALSDFLAKTRSSDSQAFRGRDVALPPLPRVRMNIVIPVYCGIETTRCCIESVLATRSLGQDRVILVDDCGPESGMSSMLREYAGVFDVHVLPNERNVGFIKSVNRGISFCHSGEVVLLNSDTEIFSGGLDELLRVAQSDPGIGTVTALSNNATIFSYPHMSLRTKALSDVSWAALAELALDRNAGLAVNVPTGHGFCMLVKREVVCRIGVLDECFGRGYGEENDLCNRAADLGYRNVAAGGVLVLHHESLSFAGETAGLLAKNLPILEQRYPEYTPTVIEAERQDAVRSCRWALDAARLEAARRGGARFALVVRHSIGGGTAQAISDIEAVVGYGGAEKLDLACRPDGFLELRGRTPSFRSVFAPNECNALMVVLSAADVSVIAVHQILGYPAAFLHVLAGLMQGRQSTFYAHDFYSLCPRVTLIDAAGRFCGLATSDVCARCVAVGGSHDSSRLITLTPAEHRRVFADLLLQFTQVITPSEDTATYIRRGFPGLAVIAVPHPSREPFKSGPMRKGRDSEVVLFGAIGPHKGSQKLLEIARLAMLQYPDLRFKIIGYTDIDDELSDVGNVAITGAYKQGDLPSLTDSCTGFLALFLSEWPETFSYTLSEALQHGFLPIVPNIGAPAERVKAGGNGLIVNSPIVASDLLDVVRKAIDAYT